MTTPPLTPDALAEWDRWVLAVGRGEVPPREVAERVLDLLGLVRASLVQPVPAPALATAEDELLDGDQVADRLGILARYVAQRGPKAGAQRARARVCEMRLDGIIPEACVVRLRRRVRYSRRRLEAWLDAGGTAAVEERGGPRL